MNELLTLERLNLLLRKRESVRDNATGRRLVTRDKLYYNFRYRKGSYKARKAMLHPFLMTAKRGLSMLRLYDDGSHQPTKVQEAAMAEKCKGWRQKEKELKLLRMTEYNKWLKDNKLKAKSNPYGYWSTQEAGSNKGDKNET